MVSGLQQLVCILQLSQWCTVQQTSESLIYLVYLSGWIVKECLESGHNPSIHRNIIYNATWISSNTRAKNQVDIWNQGFMHTKVMLSNTQRRFNDSFSATTDVHCCAPDITFSWPGARYVQSRAPRSLQFEPNDVALLVQKDGLDVTVTNEWNDFNTCTVHLLLFCTMTNQWKINWQIITLVHVSALSCHPQAARS